MLFNRCSKVWLSFTSTLWTLYLVQLLMRMQFAVYPGTSSSIMVNNTIYILHYSIFWCFFFIYYILIVVTFLGYCMWLSISYSQFSKAMLSVRRSWCTFILKTPSWSLSHTFYRSCWDLRIMKLYSDTLQPCTIQCNHNMLLTSFIQYIWFVYFSLFLIFLGIISKWSFCLFDTVLIRYVYLLYGCLRRSFRFKVIWAVLKTFGICYQVVYSTPAYIVVFILDHDLIWVYWGKFFCIWLVFISD